jgi:transcriptional regulator with XRE-family HTH domain
MVDAMSRGYGSRIAQARKVADMSQQALADAIGQVQTTISDWENEKGGKEPTLDNFEKIAQVTGHSVIWLTFAIGDPRQALDELDRSLMVQAIMTVERILGRETLRLAPEAKARLALAVYDLQKTLPSDVLPRALDALVESNRAH